MSVNPTNPSSLFGGTWVAWGQGRVPVGYDSTQTEFNTVDKTGGTKTVSHSHSIAGHFHTTSGHVLTVDEIPSHSHRLSVWNNTTSNQGNKVAATSNGSTGVGAVSVNSSGGGLAHDHGDTGTTDLTTSSDSTSNLQPYIVCYMWRRTD